MKIIALWITIFYSSACLLGGKVEKPIFKIRIQSEGVRYFAGVNGFTNFFDYQHGRYADSEIPVNEFVRTGSNSLQVQLLKWQDDDDHFGAYDSSYIRLDLKIQMGVEILDLGYIEYSNKVGSKIKIFSTFI